MVLSDAVEPSKRCIASLSNQNVLQITKPCYYLRVRNFDEQKYYIA